MVYAPEILSKMFRRDRKAWSDDISAAFFFAMILISQWPVILCLFSRKNSREIRLIRLRFVAFPTLLAAVIPRRVLWNRPGDNKPIKCLFWIFFPVCDNCINSKRFNSLSALVNKKRKKDSSSQPTVFSNLFYKRPFYADKRVLPLDLRRLIIFLPCFVDIRFKNPWVLARLILLGWYVLFII